MHRNSGILPDRVPYGAGFWVKGAVLAGTGPVRFVNSTPSTEVAALAHIPHAISKSVGHHLSLRPLWPKSDPSSHIQDFPDYMSLLGIVGNKDAPKWNIVAGSEEFDISAIRCGVLVAEGSEAWTHRITDGVSVSTRRSRVPRGNCKCGHYSLLDGKFQYLKVLRRRLLW